MTMEEPKNGAIPVVPMSNDKTSEQNTGNTSVHTGQTRGGSSISVETPHITPKLILLLIASVAVFDFFCYQESGGLGYAILFSVIGMFICIARRPSFNLKFTTLLVCLILLILRSTWQTDSFILCVGFFVLFTFTSCVAGNSLQILDLFYSWSSSMTHSPGVLIRICRLLLNFRNPSWKKVLPFVIPFAVMLMFLLIFGMANTVLFSWLNIGWEWFIRMLNELYYPQRIFFWLCAALVAILLLFPRQVFAANLNKLLGPGDDLHKPFIFDPTVDMKAQIARNTLLGVNLLFLAYNAMDVTYLWVKQSLPSGIGYSDYAREGVFWLTVALALTSAVLGIIFSGGLNFHTRTAQLKKLAYVWTIQNLFLAFLAYQRLYIYFGFNGLTRLRIVGTFGITLVMIGLVIVHLKLMRQKSFLWMVQRQLTALAMALFILFVFPADFIVSHVNVHSILSAQHTEEIAPAVIISHHPISPEGLPGLVPLLYINNQHLSADSNKIISEGAAAILLREKERLMSYKSKNDRWTYKEFAIEWALDVINQQKTRLQELIPDGNYDYPLRRFYEYTQQWW